VTRVCEVPFETRCTCERLGAGGPRCPAVPTQLLPPRPITRAQQINAAMARLMTLLLLLGLCALVAEAQQGPRRAQPPTRA
jgi:hypothetical protein